MNKDWYLIDGVDKLDSPALVIFPERVKANIQTAIGMVGDVHRLRPHIKTHKSPDATRLMLEAGITKFKCATIAEAEMLAIVGATDVLLAYQPVGPKLQRFVELVKKFPHTKFSCLVDNEVAATELVEAVSGNNLEVAVYVDLNIGMNRTGIMPGDAALQLCKLCSTRDGIKFAGLHAYDGHIHEKDFIAREKESNKAFSLVEKMREQLSEMGLNVPNIIAGGSPCFPVHAKRKNVECSPGTFVYWDKSYLDNCPEQHFLPAALLVTRIISLPSAGRICTDLGHKSVASENEIGKRIYFLNASDLKPISHSEEHLICDAVEDHHYKTGDVLYGIPWHVCPTVALYERAYIVEKGKLAGEWKNIARDRRITV